MSKPAAPQLVRALVDFYQGGQLLYKKDNVYPLDDRLQLMKARGDAQDYTSPAPVKATHAGNKRGKASEAMQQTQEAADSNAIAPSNEASDQESASDSLTNDSEGEKLQGQDASDEVAKTDDQPAQA